MSGNNKILHIAPEACLIKKFKENSNIEYITADLSSPLADIKMDIHNMPFEDENFNFVMCNHVLEHVDDDIRALDEIKRVLKKGGKELFRSHFIIQFLKKQLRTNQLQREVKERSCTGNPTISENMVKTTIKDYHQMDLKY